MAKTVDSPGRNTELVGRVARKLEGEGLRSEIYHVLDHDRKARQHVAQLLNTIACSSEWHQGYQQAGDILGDDFIPPQEITYVCGVSYTQAQLLDLAWTLPEKEVLQWARDNGFAVVAGPPSDMNLLDIYELSTDQFYQKNDPWFADKRQKFARKDTVGTTWLVVRKALVPNSTSKTWNEQNALLNGNERVPNVAEAAWFFTTYAKVRGIRLIPSMYVRTSSVGLDGRRVDVGRSDGQSLKVTYSWNGLRHDGIGIISARK